MCFKSPLVSRYSSTATRGFSPKSVTGGVIVCPYWHFLYWHPFVLNVASSPATVLRPSTCLTPPDASLTGTCIGISLLLSLSQDRDLGGDNKGTPPVCAGSRSVLTINPPKRTQRCPYLRALPSLASTECGQCDQMCVNLW